MVESITECAICDRFGAVSIQVGESKVIKRICVRCLNEISKTQPHNSNFIDPKYFKEKPVTLIFKENPLIS